MVGEFGTIFVSERKARKWRNPNTGKGKKRIPQEKYLQLKRLH